MRKIPIHSIGHDKIQPSFIGLGEFQYVKVAFQCFIVIVGIDIPFDNVSSEFSLYPCIGLFI